MIHQETPKLVFALGDHCLVSQFSFGMKEKHEDSNT